jgi:uncharacterized protein YjhX (UPF0386 family)
MNGYPRNAHSVQPIREVLRNRRKLQETDGKPYQVSKAGNKSWRFVRIESR